MKAVLIQQSCEEISGKPPTSASASGSGSGTGTGIRVVDMCCGHGGDIGKWMSCPGGKKHTHTALCTVIIMMILSVMMMNMISATML